MSFRVATFPAFDKAAVGRCLAGVADRGSSFVDLFCERTERLELSSHGVEPGVTVHRDEGFTVRYVDRSGRSWISSRDGISRDDLLAALSVVARTQPAVRLVLEEWQDPAWSEVDPETVLEMRRFAPAVSQRIKERRLGFEVAIDLVMHRRVGSILGNQQPPAEFSESFFSVELETSSGRTGLLLPRLGFEAEEQVANRAIAAFLARASKPPEEGSCDVVLAPDATAVLMHEVAAHGLEADLLSLSGNPAASVGIELAPSRIDLIDDPARAPSEVRRFHDDEGLPVARRFLLRSGCVEQPLSDRVSALRYQRLVPGAGRRGQRNLPPLPRSHHLELVPGEASPEELLAGAEGGLFASTVAGGRLDPLTGHFVLDLPWGRRVTGGTLGERVGAFRLEGTIVGLLASKALVSNDARPCGAGWCAKAGQRVPVWATMPSVLLHGVTVSSVLDSRRTHLDDAGAQS